MDDKSKNIPLIIMLSAGILSCIMCIIRKQSLLSTLIVVLFVILTFYIIGLIVKRIIVKINREAQEAAMERERALQEAKELEEQQAQDAEAQEEQE